MKGVILSLAPAQAIAAGLVERQASASQTCNINNCLIQVGGLATEASEIAAAQSSCLEYLVTITALPCSATATTTATTYIATDTLIVPAGMRRRSDAKARRQYDAYGDPDPSNPAVPEYANACRDPTNYRSACSCIGVIPQTIREPCAIALTTVTTNATLTITLSPSGSSYVTVSPSSSSSNSASSTSHSHRTTSTTNSGSTISGSFISASASSSSVSSGSSASGSTPSRTATLSLPETNKTTTSSSVSTVISPVSSTSTSSSGSISSGSTISESSTSVTASSLSITSSHTISSSSTVSANSTTTSSASSSTISPSNTCVPSVANSSAGQNTTDQGYLPLYAANYAGCFVNPNDGSQPIVLLDANTGLQVFDYYGRLTRSNSTTVNTNPTFGGIFYFSQPPDAPCGMYDLLWLSPSGDLFIAIYSNLEVGFTLISSDGDITGNLTGEFITTIWSINCAGIVTAGILHGEEIFFYIIEGGYVFALGEPVTNPLDERKVENKRSIAVENLPSTADAILTIRAQKA